MAIIMPMEVIVLVIVVPYKCNLL